MCPHRAHCPPAEAIDREDGRVVSPHRPTDRLLAA